MHNGAPHVAEAVASVLGQSGVTLELVVVDDASTDDTLGILRRFEDPRMILLPLQRNVGLVDALNLAASRASAPLLARIDADDVWLPGKLQAQVAEFAQRPSLVLLATAFQYIDAKGRVFRSEGVRTDPNALREALCQEGNQLCHASVMMRAEAFRAVGGYRKLAGRYAQDYDLWLRLLERGEVACLPEVLTQYRCHEEMLSVTRLPMQRRAAEIYRVLASQRRTGRCEDLGQAEHQVDANPGVLKDRLANDYLRWMDLFRGMGREDFARTMLWSALRSSALGPSVRSRLKAAIGWRLQPLQRFLGLGS